MLIPLIRRHLWMLVFCFVLASANVFGFDSQADPAFPPKIVSPELEGIERPAGKYKVGEVITYQIKVKWPEHSPDVRMSSPQMDLDNLELIGIGEETISGPNNNDGDASLEQILTLRFKAQNAGPAKINSLVLEWIQAGGTLASSLEIPSVDLMIQDQKNPVLWIFIFGLLSIVLVVGIIFIRRKKKEIEPIPQVKTVEEEYLNQLDQIKNSLEKDLNSREILAHLDDVIEQYIRQKFDWIRGREDYNALQKKVDHKEILKLKELFGQMEYFRFSGSELKREELMTLFQTVQTFIERKK